MTDDEYLDSLAQEIAALLPRFQDGASHGLYLSTEYQATFERLVVEAKSALDDSLGLANNFSLRLVTAARSGGVFGGPSYSDVATASELVKGAANQLRRQAARVPTRPLDVRSYVDVQTIAKLKLLKSGKWDFQRLIRLCEELNIANEMKCTFTIAMLVRAIVDHIPPIFEQPNFAGVANNYASSKSLKGSLQHLHVSLRNIADAQLHEQIRTRESIPSITQVNFSNDLEALLSEIIRLG